MVSLVKNHDFPVEIKRIEQNNAKIKPLQKNLAAFNENSNGYLNKKILAVALAAAIVAAIILASVFTYGLGAALIISCFPFSSFEAALLCTAGAFFIATSPLMVGIPSLVCTVRLCFRSR